MRLLDDARAAYKKEESPEYGPSLSWAVKLHHPYDYVKRTLDLLTISNWTCWPEAGGWIDQDEYLVEDVFHLYDCRQQAKERASWEKEHNALPRDEDIIRIDESEQERLNKGELPL